MSSPGSVVVVVLAVLLLVAAAWLLRTRLVTPWPAIVAAAVASGICFTVGGGSGRDATEPSVATVVAAVVGLLTLVAAIMAQVPRLAEPPFTKVPMYIAVGAVVIGAGGLVVNELVG
jgi:drug/metabolite transporter (DMT)-like permease